MTINTKKLVGLISAEHFKITENTEGSLNYLWYMYHQGVNKGEFRPFIYMSELMLLKKYDYIKKEELQNIMAMINSSDLDNLDIATLCIHTLRNKRIKEKGEYSNDNKIYLDLKNIYASDILNHDVFTEIILKKISER
jgi:hypothetical protein